MPVWFDATQHDPAQGSSQFPVGNGQVCMWKSGTREATQNDANSGMLVLVGEILDGPNKGAQGTYRLNLFHSTSEQARDIAHKQLSACCHVVGVYRIETPNASELFGKPFRIDVAPQKENPQYTQVVRVTDINGRPPTRQDETNNAAPAASAQPQYQPPAQPQPAAQPGWPPQGQTQPPAQQPSWQPPQTGGAPMQQPTPAAAPAQPQWTQQPPGAGKPAWAT